MTTIAYDHKNKQIACDSRETAGGCVVTDESIKYKEDGDKLWFLCGSKSDVDLFTSTFKHNDESPKNMDCSGLLVRNGVPYKACNVDGVYKIDKMSSNEGFGSGGWYAQAAVDLGLTAEKAVEYAMTRDIYSGGKVHTYDIKKGKFLKGNKR